MMTHVIVLERTCRDESRLRQAGQLRDRRREEPNQGRFSRPVAYLPWMFLVHRTSCSKTGMRLTEPAISCKGGIVPYTQCVTASAV